MDNLILLILGLFISVLGITNIKGNISTIHSYNRRKVKEEDIPKYGKVVGTGTLNIGQIPQLEKLVATIRSREISACLVLQTRSQLKAIYKDNADTIVGNMDSQIFLGGSEPTTLKDLAEALGKETIDSYNNSDTRGNSPSYGTNYQKLGHDMPYLFVKSSVALNLS